MLRNLILKSFSVNGKVNLQQVTRSYVRRVREPGIRKRLEQFSEDFVDNDPETMESLEPDFMNVHEAHKQFEQEERKFKDDLPRMIVAKKYFNEKGANFLTWSQKEQIRSLYEQNDSEWTPEKLSDSFPADLVTISKLIRNTWNPTDEMRVYKHDEAVRKNWQKFKSGELKVEPLLEEHLNKFAQRDFKSLKKPTTNKKLGTEVPKPRSNEFLSIISTCKKYATSKESEQKQLPLSRPKGPTFPDHRSSDPEQDSVILEGVKKTTMRGMPLSEYQKLSPDIVTNDDLEPIHAQETFNFRAVETHEPGLTALEVDKKLYERLHIQDHITIPRKYWKRDQTYKVGDCFYDDDGEFLYRVPGLK